MSLPSSPAVDGHPRRPKALGQLVGRDQPGLIDNRIEILPRRLRQPAALWLRQTFAPEHPDPGSSAWTKRPTISVINASTLPGAMLLGVEITRPAAARSSMRPGLETGRNADPPAAAGLRFALLSASSSSESL